MFAKQPRSCLINDTVQSPGVAARISWCCRRRPTEVSSDLATDWLIERADWTLFHVFPRADPLRLAHAPVERVPDRPESANALGAEQDRLIHDPASRNLVLCVLSQVMNQPEQKNRLRIAV